MILVLLSEAIDEKSPKCLKMQIMALYIAAAMGLVRRAIPALQFRGDGW